MSVETKQLNCINCPLGCLLTVTLEDGKITSVTGNTCPRGEKYAHQELTDPQRMLTSTVQDPRLCRSIAQRRSQSPGPYRRRHRQRYPGSRRRYRGQPRYGQRIIGTNIFPLTYTEKEAAL